MSNHSTSAVKQNVEPFDPKIAQNVDTPDMTNMKIFGGRVKQLRRSKKETQAAVAAAVGIGRTTYTGIETAAANPGRETMEALATYFDVPLGYLVGETPDPASASNDDKLVHNDEEIALLKLWRLLDKPEHDFLLKIISGLLDKNAPPGGAGGA